MEAKQQTKKRKSWIWTLLFILLNVGVLLWIGLSELKRKKESGSGFADISIQWPFFVLTLLCFLVMILAESGKIYSLIKRLTQKKDFSTAVKTTIYGYYYDNITPSGAGGQPFQIMYLRKRGLPNGASLAIPVYAFLIYQVTFVLTAGLIFLLFHNMFDYPTIRVTAVIGLIICGLIPLGIILAAVFPRAVAKIVMAVLRGLAAIRIVKDPEATGAKFIRHLNEYSEAINYINKHRRLSLEMILLSILFHIARCSLPYFILKAFGADADYLYTLVATYYIYSAIKIIPTPGGAGAAEASFYLIFSELPEPGLIFWAMLFWRFLCDYFFILGGIVLTGWDYWQGKRRIRRQKRQEERLLAQEAREKEKAEREQERQDRKNARKGKRSAKKAGGETAAAEMKAEASAEKEGESAAESAAESGTAEEKP